ncbi:MAG: DUF3300 domain-containing protein, partial [Candidatus Koribacter versatilis]|nr:DUF3300 domain-containing protein [Candidatus Koribacter versatilis]
LQEAAEKAGFDASFIALVLFPDVLKLLEQNMPWTTELGKAFTSDQKVVLASVQRLRAQAKAMGNLKTTPQQEVKTETQNGQTVIVIQPANPQVVYVPVYNTQVVYTTPPPSSGDVAAAAVIGFGLGIALGVAMSNNSYGYYGWGAWGMHWHSSVVVVHGGAWRVPPGGRYAYARPVPGYHANRNINAPRNTNININNTNVNRGNVNASGRTPRPSTTSAAATRGTTARTQPSASNNAARGRTQMPSTATRTASPARQMETGGKTSAFSGYQKGSSERAASARGRSSAGTRGGSRGGGGRRRR